VTLAEWPRRVAALGQFHVEDVAHPQLSRDDEHHLRVLRARAGDEVVVTSGAGEWALCRVSDAGLILSEGPHVDPPLAQTTLYMAPVKGERSEWAVAKATEVGLARLVPLLSARVQVNLKADKRERVLSRWRRVATEAANQCRRTWDLVIDDPVTPAEVDGDVAVCDFSGGASWAGVVAVAVGPEGGWSLEEWGRERRRVGLGPTVLRGETAAVVASSLMAFQAGRWGFTLDDGEMSNDEITR